MPIAATQEKKQLQSLPEYHQILIAADASDQSNHAVSCSVAIANLYHNGSEKAQITGAHVYAAKMHDVRFKQMEGGLPEAYQVEQELEKQRDIHDDLITKGLGVITDSYLDQIDEACLEQQIPYVRRSLEGKNYRELVHEANTGKYDLLVMGAQGLGAVSQGHLGTVCDRVSRRSAIDTLIIKDPNRNLADGPILVAIDGSTRAYGGLITAMSLAQQWGTPIKVVSAYDPYYHYVAFNRIASVLSDEAGKVFRFKEQEQLHEDIIDAGLAKIYQGHLDVAESIASDYGVEITTTLLAGKPHSEIMKEILEHKPSLLVIGKLGIHADEELDIGGNAANLLRDADCAVLLSQREYTPRIDVLAEATTSWTHEAEARMEGIPSFAQAMARGAILRFAQELGHTVITARIVDEATEGLCPVQKSSPGEEKRIESQTVPLQSQWDEEATAMASNIEDLSLRENIRRRAEKKARQEKSAVVNRHHLESFMPDSIPIKTQTEKTVLEPGAEPYWQASALARLNRVPAGFMRETVRKRILDAVTETSVGEVSLALVEEQLEKSNQVMKNAVQSGENSCPFKEQSNSEDQKDSSTSNDTKNLQSDNAPDWTDDARIKLDRVPAGTIRAMARNATEAIAAQSGINLIDVDFFSSILDTFQSGSEEISTTLPWTESAQAGISKAPTVVQGMLIKEIEIFARERDISTVDRAIVDAVKQRWDETGYFHQATDDPRAS